MLEEIEVPPGLHRSVVHRAVSGAALRTWEAVAPGEVDLDVEAAGVGIEGAGLDHPRRDQPEGHLHQIGVARRGVSRRPVEPRSCRRARGRQGVAWKRRARVALSATAILDRRSTRRLRVTAGRGEGMVFDRTKGWEPRIGIKPSRSHHPLRTARRRIAASVPPTYKQCVLPHVTAPARLWRRRG